MDARQRKLILGTQKGSIKVFNCANMVSLKDGVSHQADVSSLVYAKEDGVLMSTSWDGRLRVHEESDDPTVLTMLREVQKCHTRDITCCALSYVNSLVATGSSDFTVHLWDFQMLRMENKCIGHTAEVSYGWDLRCKGTLSCIFCFVVSYVFFY